VPARKQAVTEGFDTGAYLTEAKVAEDSSAAGKRLFEIDRALDVTDAQVIGVVRNDVRVTAPSRGWLVRPGDILVIEADADALPTALTALGLRLEEAKTPPADGEPEAKPATAEDTGNGDEKDTDDKKPAADDIVLM